MLDNLSIILNCCLIVFVCIRALQRDPDRATKN
jgi:hypothetical protein